MAANTFRRAPLRAVFYDVDTGAEGPAFLFAGNVPPAVRRALGAATSGRADKNTKTALRAYYGGDWERVVRGSVVRGGADELDILVGLDELDGPLAPPSKAPTSAAPRTGGWTPFHAPLPPADRVIVSEQAAFPEDTFDDLKAKIRAASGVPEYAQHLFWPAGQPGAAAAVPRVLTTYRLTVAGAPTSVDIRDGLQAGAADGQAGFEGLPIDRNFEARREDVAVFSDEPHLRAGDLAGTLYVAALGVPFARRPALGPALAGAPHLRALVYHGYVAKYWPALEPEAFEAIVRASSPRLPPPLVPPEALAREREVLDAVYSNPPDPPLKVSLSVATLMVCGGASFDPRPVFASLRATPDVPLIEAKFAPGRAGGPPALGGPPDPLARPPMAATSARSGTLQRVRRAQRSLGKNTPLPRGWARSPPAVALVVRDPAAPRASRWTSVVALADGRYWIRGGWDESARVDFAAGRADLFRRVAPALALLADAGLSLPTPAGRRKTGRAAKTSPLGTFTEVSANAYWPGAVSSASARELRAAFREHEEAQLIKVWGLQTTGATFAFNVVKARAAGGGLSPGGDRESAARQKADARVFEPRGARGAVIATIANQYRRLNDPSVSERWASANPGFRVRVTHRATDFQIAVENAPAADFARAVAYSASALAAVNGSQRPGGARLRLLTARDPVLFDLKRRDGSAPLYSVLCQRPKQPTYVSVEDAQKLPPARQKALAKYWNHTSETPAYYECSNPKYPRFGFLSRGHPDGLCLPCCKKTTPAPDSHAAVVDAACGKTRRVPEEDPEIRRSRHVLSYGKIPRSGRTSRMPPSAAALLFGVLPVDHEFRLAASAGHGILGAAAVALETTPAALRAEFADFVRTGGPAIDRLLGGAVADWLATGNRDPAALASAIAAGRIPAALAPDALYTALLWAVRGTGVVVFDDTGPPRLQMAAPIRAAIERESPIEFMFAVRISASGGRSGVVLPAFVYAGGERETTRARPHLRLYSSSQALAEEFVFSLAGAARTVAGRRRFDAAAVVGLRGFTPVEQIVGGRGWVCAVVVKGPAGLARIPVEYSVAAPISAGKPTNARARFPAKALWAWVRAWNKQADDSAKIVPAATLVDDQDRVVGFWDGRLAFRHDPGGDRLAGLPVRHTGPQLAWSALRRTDALPAAAAADARRALYQNHLYRLVVLELAAQLGDERNRTARAAIKRAVARVGTDIARRKTFSEFRSALVEAAGGDTADPADIAELDAAAGRFLARGPAGRGDFLVELRDTVFAFDRVGLNRFVGSPAAVARELSRFLRGAIVEDPSLRGAKFPELPNDYAACASDRSAPQCARGALRVPVGQRDALLALLAEDVLDPTRRRAIAAIAAGVGGWTPVVDPLRFDAAPDEVVTIHATN